MRDESMVIAGRLTGKWKFACFVCETEHKQENTIEKCAADFTFRLMRNRVVLGNDRMFQLPNLYEAAKKGLLSEYRAVSAAGDQVKKEQYKLNLDRFALAENEIEATRLVLSDLEAFTRKKSDEFCSVFDRIAELKAQIAASSVVLLGERAKLTVASYETVLVIDEETISAMDVRSYYEPFLKDVVVKKRFNGSNPRIRWIDVDQDRVLFELWQQWGCVRPVRTGKGVEGRVFDATLNQPLVYTLSPETTVQGQESAEKTALQWVKE